MILILLLVWCLACAGLALGLSILTSSNVRAIGKYREAQECYRRGDKAGGDQARAEGDRLRRPR